jgi:acyl dehydratase
MIEGSAFDTLKTPATVLIDDLHPGLTLGPSAWLPIDQQRVDAFADATDDHQWIHVDPVRAANGPYGGTVAHGWLTLSLMAPFTYELLPLQASAMVNYGVNRVRFPSPVPVGSRVRATFTIADIAPIDGGVQLTVAATVESEGADKPACAAELLFRAYR